MLRINAEEKKKFDIYKPEVVYNTIGLRFETKPDRIIDLKKINSLYGYEVFVN